LAWIYIWVLHKLKMVRSYKDSKNEFLRKYLLAGNANEMKPLAGKAYTNKHLATINNETRVEQG
jgi:sn-1 stearoyl-lipid 9-desaturase